MPQSAGPGSGRHGGTVVRRTGSRAAGFSHVVRYGPGHGPRSAFKLGAAPVASLLDAAAASESESHGPAGRWVLLIRRRAGWYHPGTLPL